MPKTKHTYKARPFNPGLVKVVLLDLWRTMARSEDKEPILDLQEIFRHNMHAGGPHGKMVAHADPDFLRRCLTTDCCEEAEFLRCIARAYGYDLPDDGVDRFKRILARERCGASLYCDVVSTLEALKARRYRLGVISNLWAFPEEHIFGGENPLRRYFEHRIYSYEVGYRKPEPEIFLEACRRFGVEPGNCLMVGDHPEADAIGALRVGMQAVIIDRPNELEVEVENVPVINNLSELVGLLVD